MSSRLLSGRYELLEKIGDGGMAVVYKGRDRLLNRFIAVKILRPEFTKDATFVENFKRESQAAAGLSHPNIVGVYDVGREGNINYIVMELIEGKTLTYVESGEYSADRPAYAIEADGYVVGTVTLQKIGQKEYGNPVWALADISFPVLPLEGAMITIPSNSTVYINGIALDDTYITEEQPVDEDELQYVEPYGGSIPGFTTYAISGLYYEPQVTVKDYAGNDSPVDYNADFDRYNANYSSCHDERETLEQFGIDFTSTFANVISMDADLTELDPYFPPDSLAYDYISRSTALRYFTGHGAVTMQNEEVQEFIAYNEDTVYMQVYVEQEMQMWPDPEIVPTTTHIYLTRIDGEWQISGMRY